MHKRITKMTCSVSDLLELGPSPSKHVILKSVCLSWSPGKAPRKYELSSNPSGPQSLAQGCQGPPQRTPVFPPRLSLHLRSNLLRRYAPTPVPPCQKTPFFPPRLSTPVVWRPRPGLHRFLGTDGFPGTPHSPHSRKKSLGRRSERSGAERRAASCGWKGRQAVQRKGM